MTFKEIVHRDITSVFLNPLEFGEPHNVNGKTMICVFDDIENIEREKKMKSHMDGLQVRQYFLYVSQDDFGPSPGVNSIVIVDNRKFTVVDATEEMGIHGITLEANRSR